MSAAPILALIKNKQKSVGTILLLVPRLEALVCPTLSERATQSLRRYVKHTLQHSAWQSLQITALCINTHHRHLSLPCL